MVRQNDDTPLSPRSSTAQWYQVPTRNDTRCHPNSARELRHNYEKQLSPCSSPSLWHQVPTGDDIRCPPILLARRKVLWDHIAGLRCPKRADPTDRPVRRTHQPTRRRCPPASHRKTNRALRGVAPLVPMMEASPSRKRDPQSRGTKCESRLTPGANRILLARRSRGRIPGPRCSSRRSLRGVAPLMPMTQTSRAVHVPMSSTNSAR